jgi:CubicO group peptidase (beta-lactamase class C family)
VKASHTPDAPQLIPGKRDNADDIMGYGYLWWLPETADGPYSAIGIYNQFVYVDPAHNLVIAKTSANHTYGSGTTDASYREHETFALFRAIAEKVSAP